MWSCLFLLAGYFVGNLPIVQQNFTLITYGIIAVCLLRSSQSLSKYTGP